MPATVRSWFCPHCGCDVAEEEGPSRAVCPQCGRPLRRGHLRRAPVLRGFLPLVLATGLSPGLFALLGVLLDVAGLTRGSSRMFLCAAFLASPVVLYGWSSVILRRSGEPVGILDGVPVAIFMAFANALFLGVGLSLVGAALAVR